MSTGRFFDSRAAYMMFVTTTNEKTAVATRIGQELGEVSPGPRALRVLDAGVGDGRVLTQLMRQMHRAFTHVPWLVVGKEISIEDVRQALERLPDRFTEHPEMVFVATNMYFREIAQLSPSQRREASWRVAALEGTTAHEIAQEIHDLLPELAADWKVRTSPATGNPLYERPAVLVLYRKDREFLLRPIIPQPGSVDGEFDLIIASQPYRARTSVARKARSVLVPLAEALAPGGRLVAVHSHGNDPGLEIIQGVWPGEDPFHTTRHDLIAECRRQRPDRTDLVYPDLSDEEALFRYELHAMPSEMPEHIGTSSLLAAWNAAAYVAQIEEQRLSEAMRSDRYLEATQRVLRRHGGVWFNNEAYIVGRSG